MSLPERIEEIIREKLYRCLHREVPHSITQVNRVLKKGIIKKNGRHDGSGRRKVLRIDQDIIVRTKSHYKLVMGRAGMTLNRIQDTARRDLLNILQEEEEINDIFLTLHVKLSRSQRHERNLESEREGVIQRTF